MVEHCRLSHRGLCLGPFDLVDNDLEAMVNLCLENLAATLTELLTAARIMFCIEVMAYMQPLTVAEAITVKEAREPFACKIASLPREGSRSASSYEVTPTHRKDIAASLRVVVKAWRDVTSSPWSTSNSLSSVCEKVSSLPHV